MVRGWLIVRVELVSGRGRKLNPGPGRHMLVGPTHTFKDLAEAIDQAFARWDISHLHEFKFPDGQRFGIPDEEYGQPVIDFATVRVSQAVRKGARFQYVFDFGDWWLHQCRVIASGVDPVETSGILPYRPIPVWGWGSIPDQYGRRTEEDDGSDEE